MKHIIEPKFTLLRWQYAYGWTVYNLILLGLFFTIGLGVGVVHLGQLASNASMLSTAQAEDRSTEIAPRSVGVITAHDKQILDEAARYCKDNGVSKKGMSICVERESKEMGLN